MQKEKTVVRVVLS